jgi:hypothetical protein
MSVFDWVAHSLGALQLDDSTLSVLVMLVGIIAGWKLTGWHQQMKAKRVKVARRRLDGLRKPD